jgi:hypothetical protein
VSLRCVHRPPRRRKKQDRASPCPVPCVLCLALSTPSRRTKSRGNPPSGCRPYLCHGLQIHRVAHRRAANVLRARRLEPSQRYRVRCAMMLPDATPRQLDVLIIIIEFYPACDCVITHPSLGGKRTTDDGLEQNHSHRRLLQPSGTVELQRSQKKLEGCSNSPEAQAGRAGARPSTPSTAPRSLAL